MKREDIKVAVLRIEGTNNEQEMHDVYAQLGAKPELVHLNQLVRKDIAEEDKRQLADYDVLMFPGGFSAGDYIRAGAIWAARMKAAIKDDLEAFVAEGKPIGGTCNGFQVLVELGLLPGAEGLIPDQPAAVLNRNDSALFECRPVLLRHESRGKCVFTRKIPRGKVLTIPSAHAEGKLMYPADEQQAILQRLADEDRIVFSYTSPNGEIAYPWNPNGSAANVAGITNETGTVFGMMPHPERVFHRYQHPDWTRQREYPADGPGDGRAVFESVLEYVEKKF